MSDPRIDQRGQQVTYQTNIVGGEHTHLPPPTAPHGRVIGQWPGRTAFFTGREDVLDALDKALAAGDAAVTPPPQALNGMPGIGKTTTAAEYVARSWDRYSVVAWLPAQSIDSLRAALASLGPSLSPPILPTNDQDEDAEAVRRWFAANPGWLIVADNVEDPRAVRSLLPPTATGRLLMTTRLEDPGMGAVAVKVERMDPETGALFVLRRAGHLSLEQIFNEASTNWQEAAITLSRRFDGLPLALEQAGAYIRSRKTTPIEYLKRFEAERARLLDFAGDMDHATVTVTFNLALVAVEAIPDYGPAAVQLVRLCAFMAPDPIPVEALRTNLLVKPLSSFVNDDVAWDNVLEAANRFALLERNAEDQSCSLHRLISDVVRDTLSAKDRWLVITQAIFAVKAAFPDEEFDTSGLCDRMLPHVLEVRNIVVKEEHHGKPLLPLFNVGRYLMSRGRFSEAQFLFSEMLDTKRRHEDHRGIATTLNALGLVLSESGQYGKSIIALEECVKILEQTPETDALDLANSVGNLGNAYCKDGRFKEAEECQRRALAVTVAEVGDCHPDVSTRLNDLALVMEKLGRSSEAEKLWIMAGSVDLATVGCNHYSYAATSYNLGVLYVTQRRLKDAEVQLRKALDIFDFVYCLKHPDCGRVRFWLAKWHFFRREFVEARVLCLEALAIMEPTIGLDHPDAVATTKSLETLDKLLRKGGLARLSNKIAGWFVQHKS